MPLIDVIHDSTLTEPVLWRLRELLPDLVAEAVSCPEEPTVGPPSPGDIEIRFRQKGPLDVGELNCVVEVRTKLFDSRVRNKHQRADIIRDGILRGEPRVGQLGVWLILADGSWSQV